MAKGSGDVTKGILLTNLTQLENGSKGKNKMAYIVLKSLYRDHPSSQLEKYVKWNSDVRKNFMRKQHATLSKNTSIKHTTNASNIVNIKMDDDKMHDLLLMIWLDMEHDELLPNNLLDLPKVTSSKGTTIKAAKVSFTSFLNSGIKKLITSEPIQYRRTDMVKKLIEKKIVTDEDSRARGRLISKDKVEIKMKTNMHVIWGDGSLPKTLPKTANIMSIVRPNKKTDPIYVSYDAENSNYITSLLAKTKMENQTYYLKRIFTIANLMDPGRGADKSVGGHGKSGGSVDKLISRIFDETNTSTPFKFNYQPFEFKFGKYCKIEIIADKNKFNAKLNGELMSMGITASRAKNGYRGQPPTLLEKLSKTFGDFLQILTVAHLRKSGINVVSSSQDGGFVGMTGFVQNQLFRIQNPALISDSTTLIGTGNQTTGIRLYGLEKNIDYNRTPTKSHATTKQQQIKANNKNLTNNANSGNSRNSGNSKRNSKSTNNSSKIPVVSSSPRKPTSTPNKQGIKRKVNNAGLNNSKRSNNTSNSMNSGFSNTSNSTNVAARSQRSNNYTVNSARNLLVNGLNKLTHLTNQDKKAFISNFGNDPNVNRVLKAAKNKNTLILQEKNKFIRAIRKLTSLNKTKQNMYISSYNRGLNSENLLKRAKNDNNNAKEIAQVRRAKTLRPRSKI